MSGLMAGKRLLVTGVITDQSIAYSVARLAQSGAKQPVSKKTKASCELCYFRQAGLCALPESPCPTFRPVGRGTLSPPQQASLIPRVAQHAA